MFNIKYNSSCLDSLHRAFHHHTSSATLFQIISSTIAAALTAFIVPSIITLVQPLFFKGLMPWTLMATITIGFFVGLAVFLGCL